MYRCATTHRVQDAAVRCESPDKRARGRAAGAQTRGITTCSAICADPSASDLSGVDRGCGCKQRPRSC